jgi:hypothetical protein
MGGQDIGPMLSDVIIAKLPAGDPSAEVQIADSSTSMWT